MVNILGVIGITFAIASISSALGYWIYTKTRPVRLKWIADVYQEGKGIIPSLKNEIGEIISDVRLKELKPYTVDEIERIEKDKGIVVYRLNKLNKTVPQVTGDCVENWGGDNKRVAVLMEGESCTLMRRGYDRKGQLIFHPLPYEDVNMITNQMSIKKDRLMKEKDILQAVLPYVAMVIAFVSIVAIAWVNGEAYIQQSENNIKAQELAGEYQLKAADVFRSGLASYGAVETITTQLGQQKQNNTV